MSDNTPIDFEKLRPDIYLTDEQKAKMHSDLRPPDFMSVVRKAEPSVLAGILRGLAYYYEHEEFPSGNQCGSIEEQVFYMLQGASGNQLHDLLLAVADNVENLIYKGEIK